MKKTEYNLNKAILNNNYDLFKTHFTNAGISLNNLNAIVENHKKEMFSFVIQKKDLSQYYDKLFDKAIDCKNFPICKTILDAETTNPKNKKKTKNRFSDILNNYLKIQCQKNELDILKVFMTSEVSSYIDIYSPRKYKDNFLTAAIEGRNIDIVRFLLFSPDIKENFKLSGYKEFHLAVLGISENFSNYRNTQNIKEKSMEIVHCLLYEAKLEITEKYYENFQDAYKDIHPLVRELVEKRALFMKLNYNLDSSDSKTKRIKI